MLGRSGATGRFWYASNASGGQILVFDKDGSFLRFVGGRGRGSGEFLWIHEILAREREVHVIDAATARWTILSPEFETRATWRLPRPPFATALVADSLLVASMRLPTRHGKGHPLHVIGPGKGVIRSFGADPGGDREDPGLAGLRQVAPGNGDRFWAAHLTRYRVEAWSLEEERLVTFERDVEWFPPHDRGLEAHPEIPPAPWLAGIREDREGLLWVLVHVADDRWHAAVERRPDGAYRWASDRTGFQDTILEVLDPRTGEVLAQRRSDLALRGFIDDRHVAAYRESPGGVPRVEVWRVELRRD